IHEGDAQADGDEQHDAAQKGHGLLLTALVHEPAHFLETRGIPGRALFFVGDGETVVEYEMRDARDLVQIDLVYRITGTVIVLVSAGEEEDGRYFPAREVEVIAPEEEPLFGPQVIGDGHAQVGVALVDAVQERPER